MSALSGLFASELLIKLLGRFLLNPEQEFYQAQLQEYTGGTLSNVQKMLQKLELAGLVTRYKRGNMAYYRANREHPVFEDLKRLFIKTFSIGDVLKGALSEFANQITLAFIFGSYARGEEGAQSDIDLFILGDLSLKALAPALGAVTDQVGREINPVIYSADTFQNQVKAKNRFIMDLLSCPKIWLIGSEHDLEAMVG